MLFQRTEDLAARGGGCLATGHYAEASAVLGAALGLWRGSALDGLPDGSFAQPVAARLEELRLTAREDRFDAELRLGKHAEDPPSPRRCVSHVRHDPGAG